MGQTHFELNPVAANTQLIYKNIMYAEFDSDGNLVAANPAFNELTGQLVSGAASSLRLLLQHYNDAEYVQLLKQLMLPRAQALQVMLLWQLPEAGLVPVECEFALLESGAGLPRIHLIALPLEVTLQYQARYDFIACMNNCLPLIMLNNDGQITDMSASLGQILACSPADVIGQTLNTLCTNLLPEHCSRLAQQVLDDGLKTICLHFSNWQGCPAKVQGVFAVMPGVCFANSLILILTSVDMLAVK